MGEKQKLQMEIEEQRAAMQEIEMRETKMKQEAKLKDEEIKVKEFSVTANAIQCKKCAHSLADKSI